MLMSRNKREEVRRSSYWAEFPSKERRRRQQAHDQRRATSERRSSKWKSRFQQIIGRPRPEVALPFETIMRTGWEKRKTLDGNIYYYELDTGRVTWEKPDSLKTPQELEDDKAEWVWVPHPTNVWQPARVKSRDKNVISQVTLLDKTSVNIPHIGIMKGKLTGGVSQKVPLWPLKRAALDIIEEDLVALPALDEGMILHNLRIRYESNDIYTWVGSSRTVLIAVNPFQELAIHTKDHIEIQRMGPAAAAMGRKLEPHVYGIANDSLDALLFENKSQSILVSGESGSGKTYSTKQCLDFLAHVAASRAPGSRNSERRFEMVMGAADPDQKVEQKVLVANPVLEAFGNAKTVRNNNSSRFGKWIAVHIERRSKMINGASITSFLLESSRVTIQAKNERNYHIFYQLLTDDDVIERYMLQGGAESFHYINQSGCIRVDAINDTKEFREVVQALEDLAFKDEEQEWLMRTTAAVLHLGNVNFVEIKTATGQKGCRLEEEESQIPKRNKATGAAAGEEGADEPADEAEAEEAEAEADGDDSSKSAARRALEHASELLEIEHTDLERVLTQRTITVRGELSTIPLKVNQAKQARDSLAKAIYSRLFDWLVARVNESFGDAEGKFIGILDIFGFEIFEHNSFEQLCINYANERLQQLFNQHTFGDEEELYELERVPYKHIDFQDNQPVLDLIDKRPDGILNLLDDECVVPGGTDLRLMGRIEAIHHKHKFFKSIGANARQRALAKKEPNAVSFTVKHFAGSVTYDAIGFIAKNSDTLFQDLYDICSRSTDDITQDLFPVLEENDRIKVVSQSAKFRTQLNELMGILEKTQSRYIRCIKPNDKLVGNLFEGRKCLEQLRSSGVFEAVAIRKTGYPFRMMHDEFVRRYRCINLDYTYRNKGDSDHSMKALCQEIIDASPQKFAGVQLGELRVLYRTEDHKMLELLRDLALSTQVPKIQAAWRRGLARKLFRNLGAAERELREAINGEPDISALVTAIENVPDTLGSIGSVFKITPPSLAKAKELQAGLERWEEVEEDMEEFEDLEKLSDDEERSKAERVIKAADRLRDDDVPMTEAQKELYDHIKQLLVGGSVEDLDDKAIVALESHDREVVEEVTKEAENWARSTATIDKLKEATSRFHKLDSDAKRAIDVVDRNLLERVAEEADEMAYSDTTIEKVKEMLALDELAFINLEIECARRKRDRKRRKYRMLRKREIDLSRMFTEFADFFSMERMRGQTATTNSCVATIKKMQSSLRPHHAHEAIPEAKPDKASLTEIVDSFQQRHSVARSGFEDPVPKKKLLDDDTPASNTTTSSHAVTVSRNGKRHTDHIDTSILFTRDKADIRQAVANFENVRTYMGDSRRATSNAARNVAGLAVLRLGLERMRLRDEIYAQIIMQLTNNPSEASTVAGLDLLCLVVAAFPPTDEPFENFFTVWCKLHLPAGFYSTVISMLHDHRFAPDQDERHERLLNLIYLNRAAFSETPDDMPPQEVEGEEAQFEMLKAEHGLEALRKRFQSFQNGSRFSMKHPWESDPWEKNPDYSRYRKIIVPENFKVDNLEGFSSEGETTADTRTIATAERFRARLVGLQTKVQSSVRNAIDNLPQPTPRAINRTGSVVQTTTARERLREGFGKVRSAFRN